MRQFVLLVMVSVFLSSCAAYDGEFTDEAAPPIDRRLIASETGVDITALPSLGTPATTSDTMVTYDASAAEGSRITKISFDSSATNFLNGDGEFAIPAGVNTSLSTGTVTGTTYGITSDGATNDVILAEATTTTSGILGAAKWNEIVANTAKATGYDDLTSFVDQTAWRVFYSNAAGDVIELALGADGKYLMSNGPAVAPTFETASAGSETNTLETTITGIEDTEIFIGDGTNSGTFVSMGAMAEDIGTTGVITGKIETATDSNAHTLLSDEYHGGSVLATGAGIYSLPTAAAGYSGCVEAGYGVTAILQLLPASGDYIVHEGERGTIATSIKSTGEAGDMICYRAYNDTDWYVSVFGTWEE